MKKRKLLSLTLAGTMVLGLLASCGEKTPDPTPTPEAENTAPVEVTYDETKTADVIIVGAGGAGLAAAISAVDAGAESVIIVEKLGKTGGSLNYTSGSMSGAETVIQKLDGIEDTKQSYIEDILSNGAQLGNREMIETYVEEDVAAIQWLWDNGLSEYTFSEQGGKKSVFAPEHQLYSIQRTYKPRAMDREHYKSAAHEILDKVVAGYDKITIDFNTEVEALLGNEKGQVLTAVASNLETGKSVRYDANKGIIMATGGYSGNPAMMGEFAKYGENYLVGGADSADGKGIRIMQLVGAQVDKDKLSYIPTFPMGLEYAPGKGLIGDIYTWKTGGIYVNQNGERFVNETLDEVVPRETALEEQPGAVQYNIYTDKIVEDLKAANAAYMYTAYYEPENGVGHKLIVEADSIEELAGKIGVPAETLKKTVDDYNAAVDSKGTDEFGRDFSGEKLNTYNVAINKIEGEKYYACPIKALVVMTLGGVTTNTDTQVLDESGNPIPGLYAAGEVVGGIWGKFVSGGTGVMGPIVFGRIAGRNVMGKALAEGEAVKAASYVLDEKLFPVHEAGGNKTTASFDMSKALTDGEYTATVDGQEGAMTVKTTVTGGKIANVEVTDNHETAAIGGPALESVPKAIVAANSVTVDAVSGATLTSNRIASAVQQCLEQAAK